MSNLEIARALGVRGFDAATAGVMDGEAVGMFNVGAERAANEIVTDLWVGAYAQAMVALGAEDSASIKKTAKNNSDVTDRMPSLAIQAVKGAIHSKGLEVEDVTEEQVAAMGALIPGLDTIPIDPLLARREIFKSPTLTSFVRESGLFDLFPEDKAATQSSISRPTLKK